MPLSPERRAQLDGIVAKMDADGASSDEIRTIVDDFKSKFEGSLEPVGGALPRFLGGVKKNLVDPVVDTAKEGMHYVQQHPVEASVGNLVGLPQMRAAQKVLGGVKSGIESEAAKAGALMDVAGPGARGPSGRGLSSTGHAIAAAVPVVGPLAANVIERGAGGDVAGAAGEFTGLVAAGALPVAAAEGMASRAARVANASEAGSIASQGMSATRVASAAKNAEELAAANKAAADLHEWMRVDRQTPEALTNRAVGLKAGDFKKGYDPTSGAMRTGVIDNFDQPATDILGNVDKKFTELSTKKAEGLKASTSAATPDDILKADDVFQPILERAAKQGNKVRVRKIATLRRNLLEQGSKDLTPEGIQKHIDLVDDHITDFGGEGNAYIRRGLEKYRRQLSDLRDQMVPEGVPLNKDMRDLIPVKNALKNKIASEAAAHPDESTLKAPTPLEPAVPAPGQDIPPGLMEKLQSMTPMEQLDLIKAMGLDALPFPIKAGMRVHKALSRVTK